MYVGLLLVLLLTGLLLKYITMVGTGLHFMVFSPLYYVISFYFMVLVCVSKFILSLVNKITYGDNESVQVGYFLNTLADPTLM